MPPQSPSFLGALSPTPPAWNSPFVWPCPGSQLIPAELRSADGHLLLSLHLASPTPGSELRKKVKFYLLLQARGKAGSGKGQLEKRKQTNK